MNHSPRARRFAAALAAGVVAPSLALIAAAPAHADPADTTVSVNDAQFRWGLNNESNNAAYAPGTFNLFSAGKIGNPEAGGQTLNGADSGTTWSNGKAAGWKVSDGNVTIEKKQADGSYAPTTWAGTKTAPDGSAVTVNSSTFTDHQVVIDQGTGTLDPAADDADITWDGDFTALYYSGMTYFTVSDPHLVLDHGVGTLTATLGGYATDMSDPTKWNPLSDTEVTLADLHGVDVTATGLLVTPDYVGVAYDAPSGATAQAPKTSANEAYWGSFPQSFVDFQQLTGSSSYWYSSGGQADTRKQTLPLQVKVGPRVSVSTTSVPDKGQTKITVTGTGFDPASVTGTRPPLAGKSTGAYIAFGKFPANWKPSAGVASTERKTADVKWAVLAEDMATVGGPAAGAIELKPDGSFTAELTVDKAAADTAAAAVTDAVNYGIYTYPGGGATQPAFETYTPITFIDTTAVTVTGTTSKAYGAAGSLTIHAPGPGTVTVTGLGAVKTLAVANGLATFPLPVNLPVGRATGRIAYSGDDTHASSTVTASVTVTKASPRLTFSWSTAPAKGKKAVAVVTVARPAGVATPTGSVKLTLKKGKKTVTVAAALKAGKAKLVITKKKAKKLVKGSWKVAASYTGDRSFAGVTKSGKVKVKVKK